MSKPIHALLFGIIVLTAGCAGTVSPPPTLAPEAGKRVVASRAVVTSASPLASEVGISVLRAGGNAVDAAVAVAFALGVVEPQMSGLGGGGSALVWLQTERRAEYLDFYSAQPVAAFRRSPRPDTEHGELDLRVVAVPGEVAGLAALHERFGRLAWAELVEPAIRLAEVGFPVNQILAQMVQADSAKLHRFAEASIVFWPDGQPLAPGARLLNPALARTLRLVAEHGAAGFYEGEVAEQVVGAMNDGGHPVSVGEFAGFEPRWKRPLCTDYRGMVALSAPPPQTGAQVLHTLKMIEPHDLRSLGLPTRSAQAFDVLVSALRAGIVDNRANDDPDWGSVPAAGRITAAYARQRGELVGAGRAPDRVEPGDPSPFDTLPPSAACARLEPYGPAAPILNGSEADPAGALDPTAPVRRDGRVEFGWADVLPSDPAVDVPHRSAPAHAHAPSSGETTHLSVVDTEGNAVALTQTNSSPFGAGALAAGFFLNDSGYRFEGDDIPVATAGGRDWRTRASTIAPIIMLEDGRVRLVAGAPGGGRIPTAIAQNIVFTLDYGLDPMEALRMPRVFPSPDNRRVQLENGFGADVLEHVRAMGYEPTALSSGYARLYMIVRAGDHWIGVADPRHDGAARGF